jgi:F0F1-type ATP synthase assembly protein I
MLSDINLQNPTIRRMVILQLGITVGFAIIAGIISGEHGAVSAVLGGLTNVFASVIFVFVANVGLRTANRLGQTGMWPLLRAELVKLVFIVIQLGLIIKFGDAVGVAGDAPHQRRSQKSELTETAHFRSKPYGQLSDTNADRIHPAPPD